MERIFGHLEVLHSKFHDPTISNLGDQSGQTDKQTDKQTKRQTDIVIYIVDLFIIDPTVLGLSPFDQMT